ncbi:EscI/YscI/HrpB family type III secretion system inner rod protein [Dyella sp. M7H15-1]|uniref:type III secretion system inner rod subunit SctI n=1 Tax=Dyella sp. M7H15-1 TaxID=2501295 RepID=UPI0010050BDA|nr:type III secretion system inner rod subunit SctI [Dyella sp. M7H15-1]QAU24831.1 EscI/YscI/HrpB family type III secretion system inner rod protein [Dyella sp. M7H15-1]
MNIADLQHLLGPLAKGVEPVPAAAPTEALQSQFAELLSTHTNATTASDNALAVQGALSQLTVGTDLAAKVFGSLAQSINKLTNMQ